MRASIPAPIPNPSAPEIPPSTTASCAFSLPVHGRASSRKPPHSVASPARAPNAAPVAEADQHAVLQRVSALIDPRDLATIDGNLPPLTFHRDGVRVEPQQSPTCSVPGVADDLD